MIKVRDLIKQNADLDVYDDVCEELAIAFCGPLVLTEEGEKHFAGVLDLEVQIEADVRGAYAVVLCDDLDESVMGKNLEMAKEFFGSAAGYCSEKDYKRWFEDEG